ncbi:MAG: hypothetical protein NVV59_01565 [Chitinophagaceae bacterium]|nr:hypothetical protein [Chitinophagaceae bacterium]
MNRSNIFKQLALAFTCTLLLSIKGFVQSDSVNPVFTIIHLPRSAGYTKPDLNAEIKSFTKKEEIRNWIKRKKALQELTLILKVANHSSSPIYWTIRGKEKIEKEQNYIAPMSKFTQSAKAFKLSDLNGFFKDTLVLFDTLAIELYLKEKNYPVDQFIISFSCRKKSQSIAIVNDDNKLIFSPNIFEPCAISEADIRITNKQNPQRNIANCRLIFLGEEQKRGNHFICAAFTGRKSRQNFKRSDIGNFSLLSANIRHSLFRTVQSVVVSST